MMTECESFATVLFLFFPFPHLFPILLPHQEALLLHYVLSPFSTHADIFKLTLPKNRNLAPHSLANIYKYTTYWWGLNGITRLWRLLWWGTQPLPSLFHIMNPSVQWFPRSIQSINCGIHSRQRKINCYLQSQCSEITGFMRGWLSPLTQWFRSTHISLAGVNYDHPCPRMQREKKEPFAFFL